MRDADAWARREVGGPVRPAGEVATNPRDGEERKTAAAAEAAPERKGGSLRGVAEALALYAALPAVLMYPFGLLVLCVQVRLTYLDSLAASWYAANLVPRPVAMGIGAGAAWNALAQPRLAFYAAIFAVAVGIVAFMLVRERRRPLKEREAVADAAIRRSRYHFRIPVVDLVVLPPSRRAAVLIAAAFLGFFALEAAGFALDAASGEWGRALSDGVLSLGFAAGLLFLARDALDLRFGRGSLARVLLRGSAAAFAGLLLAALIGSAPREPSLPRVELTGGDVRAGGELLAHEGGQWYFFEEGARGLRAVPDRRAGDATIEGGRGG